MCNRNHRNPWSYHVSTSIYTWKLTLLTVIKYVYSNIILICKFANLLVWFMSGVSWTLQGLARNSSRSNGLHVVVLQTQWTYPPWSQCQMVMTPIVSWQTHHQVYWVVLVQRHVWLPRWIARPMLMVKYLHLWHWRLLVNVLTLWSEHQANSSVH